MDLKLNKQTAEHIRTALKPFLKTIKESSTQVLNEVATILTPRSFTLKTEYLSGITKETHLAGYKNYVDSHNRISSRLDSIDRTNVDNPNDSEYRNLKIDEQFNMNAVKLHELYFTNISDLHSEIRMDSIPFLRISKEWGTFDKWQLDFIACAMSSREGWVMLYFDPFKQKYFNTFFESHTNGVPVMAVPVLVIDTHHGAWWKDYPEDKRNYLNAMMLEINWAVVEARMVIAEMCQLHKLYMIEPVGATTEPKNISVMPSREPPIGQDQIVSRQVV